MRAELWRRFARRSPNLPYDGTVRPLGQTIRYHVANNVHMMRCAQEGVLWRLQGQNENDAEVLVHLGREGFDRFASIRVPPGQLFSWEPVMERIEESTLTIAVELIPRPEPICLLPPPPPEPSYWWRSIVGLGDRCDASEVWWPGDGDVEVHCDLPLGHEPNVHHDAWSGEWEEHS